MLTLEEAKELLRDLRAERCSLLNLVKAYKNKGMMNEGIASLTVAAGIVNKEIKSLSKEVIKLMQNPKDLKGVSE